MSADVPPSPIATDSPPRSAGSSGAGPVIAVLQVTGEPDRFIPTLRSLRNAHPDLPIVLGTTDRTSLGDLDGFGAEIQVARSAEALINDVSRRSGAHVLVIGEAVLLPAGFLDNALGIVAADLRIATVSFFSNAAGFLSFPHRNRPQDRPPEGTDESSITRRLRALSPAPRPAPIPIANGAVVLISSSAVSAIGLLNDVNLPRLASSLAEFCLRARARGFIDVLDPGTFYSRPSDISPAADTWLDLDEQELIFSRHRPPAAHFSMTIEDTASPLALAHRAAAAKILGLRVLVDGSCLGPRETGTQVQTLSLIGGLARHPDVTRVCVALGDTPGDYAREILDLPGVDARITPPDDYAGFGAVDIVHRPFQPDRSLHIEGWRQTGARTVVTIQDLIGYHVGDYFESGERWLDYRRHMVEAAADVDGIVVISHDTARNVELEQLPTEPSRVFVVENGTDHLTGEETARMPAELLAQGFSRDLYLLVLGTNYAHKNRDLAVRVWREMRGRGWSHALVLAGACVPFGSSRVTEAKAWGETDGMWVIPDVDTEGRNWLLRHASLMLYPTSAEGFGLLPYEAARFGTPTVSVDFGPLREVAGSFPESAENWATDAFVDAAEAVLGDPARAQEQIASALAAGAGYTWAGTADKLVATYRSLLARPSRVAGRAKTGG